MCTHTPFVEVLQTMAGRDAKKVTGVIKMFSIESQKF